MAAKSAKTLPHLCKTVSLLCVYMMQNNLVDCYAVISDSHKIEILNGLPQKSHLEIYLNSLEKVVSFVYTHRSYVDLNLILGIFLTNVNLRHTMKMEGHMLSDMDRLRLNLLLKKNDDIKEYFLAMVRVYSENIDPNDEAPIGISELFTNETAWSKNVTKFHTELLNLTASYSRKELEKFFKWPLYKTEVETFYRRFYPKPRESDACLELLSQHKYNKKSNLTFCRLPMNCKEMARNGMYFGYGKLQRMLFFLMTRYSRRCVILSTEHDKKLFTFMCASAYNEARLIAYHCFESFELLLGFVSLCAIEGHAQFLQRSWLDELLHRQTKSGCFNQTIAVEELVTKMTPVRNTLWQFMIPNYMVMNDTCNVRMTSFAAGVLSATIRYILETHY